MNFHSKLIIAAALSFSMTAQAQSPVSGFMTALASGIYFVRLIQNNQIRTTRLTLVR